MKQTWFTRVSLLKRKNETIDPAQKLWALQNMLACMGILHFVKHTYKQNDKQYNKCKRKVVLCAYKCVLIMQRGVQ